MSDLGLPGKYKARIVKWGISEASTGTPSVDFTCELLMYVNEDGEEEDVPEGMEKIVRRHITDKTAQRVINELRTLGYDRNDFNGCDPDSDNPFDFAGKPVGLVMKIETYKDNDQERWEFEFSGAVKPLEKSKLAGLNAKFGGLFKANPAGSTSKPAAKTPTGERAAAAKSTQSQGEEIF